MDLSKILSITGKPGLFKMISQTKNGAIVEGLIDNKRFQIFASHQVSSLEEISIFTSGDDLSLKTVLKNIYAKLNGEKAPGNKAEDKELRAFFEEVIPNYDKERVYTSHIRKILTWYNLLIENDLLKFPDEELPEEPIAKKTEE